MRGEPSAVSTEDCIAIFHKTRWHVAIEHGYTIFTEIFVEFRLRGANKKIRIRHARHPVTVALRYGVFNLVIKRLNGVKTDFSDDFATFALFAQTFIFIIIHDFSRRFSAIKVVEN